VAGGRWTTRGHGPKRGSLSTVVLIAAGLVLWAYLRARDAKAARRGLLERVARLERDVAALKAGRPAGGIAEAAPEAELASAEEPWLSPDELPAVSRPGGGSSTTPSHESDGADATSSTESGFGGDAETSFASGSGDEPPPPPAPSGPAIDWESWLGVRGAAVLGGAVLALAGLFFFRYSIEHGLLPPWLRVVIGLATGVAGIGLSEWALRREYAGTANALAGAGVVILYAAFWAAGPLYGLVPSAVTFVGLAAATAVCCALSWRHRSQVVATIGLVGGFLTPFFASSGDDHPIGLFAYILVLDAALVYTGRRNRWPSLVLLSLIGTTLYQALWIAGRMDPGRTLLGLAIVGVFAAFFAVEAGSSTSEGDSSERPSKRGWIWARASGVLLPFGFAVYFALRADLGDDFLPLGLLLLLLSAAAALVSRVQRTPQLALGAAAAAAGVLCVWIGGHAVDAFSAWTVVGIGVALVAIFHLFVEWERDSAGWGGPVPAAVASAAGIPLGFLLGTLSSSEAPFWPWYVGWLAITGVLLRHATLPSRGILAVAAPVGLGFALFVVEGVQDATSGIPTPAVVLTIWIATGLLLQGGALVLARGTARAAAEHGAAAFATIGLLALLLVSGAVGITLAVAGATLLGVLITLASTRLGGGPWAVVAVGATALAHFDQVADVTATLPLLIAVFVVALWFVAWPFLAAHRLASDAWSWRAAALAGPAWFLPLGVLWDGCFGDAAIGLLPLLLGGVAVAAAARVRQLFEPSEPLQTTRLAWLLGVALGFVTVAIPLQVEREWITVGWALEGLALIVLWERLDHAGLKYVAIALFAAVAIRLVANDEVLAYHSRGSWRIVNWLLYTYWIPAAALFVASRRLGRLELSRLRPFERSWYVREAALGSGFLGLAGLAVVFVWINLAIADWFTTGPILQVDFERLPARDLATSIAWGVYALCLLALGVRLRSRPLRWVSLLLLLVTIGKVFLHDVGELGDLYRVASLLGLAISLILVSLAYQRFVLRERSERS
jgi:uncharacterized membrane protein